MTPKPKKEFFDQESLFKRLTSVAPTMSVNVNKTYKQEADSDGNIVIRVVWSASFCDPDTMEARVTYERENIADVIHDFGNLYYEYKNPVAVGTN